MLKSLINNFNSVAKLYAYKHFLPWWAFEYHRKKIQRGAGPPPYIYLLVEVLLFVKLFSNLNLDVNWAIGGHFKLYTTLEQSYAEFARHPIILFVRTIYISSQCMDLRSSFYDIQKQDNTSLCSTYSIILCFLPGIFVHIIYKSGI